MTHLEAKEVLKNRVEWKKPLDSGFSFLSFDAPESGRFIQEEHSSVRIPIIYETVVDIDIADDDFQDELQAMKERAILQMLHDVFFDQKEIQSIWIEQHIGLFDYAIILRNTLSVLSDILNSIRINITNKITEKNLNKWFVDLNGMKDNDKGIYVKGFASRYNREIERIRKVLFIKDKRLKVLTAR